MGLKPGKKAGSPKTGGRTKGTSNRLTADYKDIIAKSNPIDFLISAFTKGYIEGAVNPIQEDDSDKYLTLTFKERCDIARDLAKKIVPDLKAVEHTGKDGEAIDHSITVTFITTKSGITKS